MNNTCQNSCQEFESFDERLDIFVREIELAIKWQRPSILLAVYPTDVVHAEVEAALENKIIAFGQQVMHIRGADGGNPDISQFVSQVPGTDRVIFFVDGLSRGGEKDGFDRYRALNVGREYFVEKQIRIIFWLTEDEAVSLAHFAPDFWASRHRVIDFIELQKPDEVFTRALEPAWQGQGEDKHMTNNLVDTRAKISLRETTQAGLPEWDGSTTAGVNLLLTLGIMHWRKGDPDKADESLHSALDIAIKTQDKRLEAVCFNAIALVKTDLGLLDQAVEAYEQAIELAPEKTFIWGHLGNLYSQLGQYQEAVDAFLNTLEHNPVDSIVWNSLGNAYGKVGQIDEAIDAYRKALELNDRFVEPWMSLGSLFRQQGLIDDAIIAFQKVTEIDTHSAQAWNELSNMYFELEAFDEAIEAYNIAIKLGVETGWSCFKLAFAYARKQEFASAIPFYLKSIELFEDDADKAMAWNRLGNVYREVKDYDNAIQAYQRADKLVETNASAYPDIPVVGQNIVDELSTGLLDQVREMVTADNDGTQPQDAVVTLIATDVATTDEPVQETAGAGTPAPEDIVAEVATVVVLEACAAEPVQDECATQPELGEGPVGDGTPLPADQEQPEVGALEPVSAELPVGELLLQAVAEIKEEAEEVEEIVEKAAEDVKEEAGEVVEEVKEVVGKVAEEAKEEVSEAVEEAKEVVGQVVEEAKEEVGEAVEEAKEVVGQVVEEAQEEVSEAVEEAKEVVGQVVEEAKEEVSEAVEEAKEVVGKVAEEAKEVASEAVEEAKVVAGKFVEEAQEEVSEAVDETKEIAGEVMEEAKAAAGEAAEEVKAVVGKVKEEVGEVVEEAKEEAGEVVAEVVTGAAVLVSEVVETLAAEIASASDDLAEPEDDILPEEPAPAPSATEVDMRNAHIWNELGNIYFKVGAYDEALEAYNKAVELGLNVGLLYSNLGFACAHKGKYAEAIPHYQKSIELLCNDGEKALSWGRLGDVYGRMDDFENALAAYQKSLELEPSNPSFIEGLAEFRKRLALLDATADAQVSFEEAAAKSPQGETTDLQAGQVEELAVLVQVAVLETDSEDEEDLPAAQEDESDDGVVAGVVARMFEQQAVPEMVSTAADASLPENDPVVADVAAETASLHVEAVEEAIDGQAVFLAGQPAQVEVVVAEEVVAIDAGPEAGASGEETTSVQDMGSMREIDLKNAHIWNELGHIFARAGNFDDAIDAYKKAIELDPAFAWPYSNLALAHAQKGQYGEAVPLYQKSIELFDGNKDKAVSWNRLGDSYRQLNEYDNAIAAYQIADELNQHDNDNVATDSLREVDLSQAAPIFSYLGGTNDRL